MTNPTKQLHDFFSTIRVLLTWGLLEKLEVVKWADNEIQRRDKPDDYFIVLSLIGTKSTGEINDLLDGLADGSKSLISGRSIIGLVSNYIKDGLIDYKKGFEILYSVQREFELTELERSYINHADDELELSIKQVWGDKDQVQKSTMNYLNCYEGFTLDNVDNWEEISKQVNEKLKLWDKRIV